MVVVSLIASVSHSGRRQGHQLRWERECTIERLWMKLWSRVSESGEENAQEKSHRMAQRCWESREESPPWQVSSWPSLLFQQHKLTSGLPLNEGLERPSLSTLDLYPVWKHHDASVGEEEGWADFWAGHQQDVSYSDKLVSEEKGHPCFNLHFFIVIIRNVGGSILLGYLIFFLLWIGCSNTLPNFPFSNWPLWAIYIFRIAILNLFYLFQNIFFQLSFDLLFWLFFLHMQVCF